MKEFDFEELDRAVNSLMKDAPGTRPVKADDDVTTVTLPDAADPAGQPQQPQTQAVAAPTPDASQTPETPAPEALTAEPTPEANSQIIPPAVENTTPEETVSTEPAPIEEPAARPEVASESAPKRSIVPHRNGRFMDMKHDASTMRPGSSTTNAVAAPSARASRVAALVEPAQPIVDVVPPVDESPAAELPEETTSVPAEEPAAATDQKSAEYSAFLPDAKVEKRPLGQPQPLAPVSLPDVPVEVPAVDESTKETKDVGTPAATDAPLSAEFDQHLMAIESGDSAEEKSSDTSEAPTSPKVDTPTKEETPALAKQQSDAEPTTPSGPASIQQQYKESPSSGDQTNGAIYDTASYHQPLKHPEKKKSGWLWVILIVVVILLGVGAGAFIYLNGI